MVNLKGLKGQLGKKYCTYYNIFGYIYMMFFVSINDEHTDFTCLHLKYKKLSIKVMM